ncbi:PREDICTED: uncharacterized protein LOC106852505 isoform X2 [Sturnus vulgaris]|uniref:uncharacterized protein LOC106852505 isoform X2 n=1 Tax=Sturnus vulgaris TaxID=9172 RepID=UPI00071A5797|nr:PREDICTED: uncharacterized protein LOC106852505 isoform X2 [Sturnus vulgaris]XP_014730663.1 PREDICTED: uncharacterized protein LOC106852505 isoform X2 [Sturnus vulgaris]
MTAVPEEVKAEDGKAKPEKKQFYCEVCKISCMCAINLQSHYRGAKHRKQEKALRRRNFYSSSALIQVPMKFRVLRPVKRAFTGYITCLKDFMNDPRREEPLIGLEHVVEIRFEGRKEPRYECRLCGCNAELAPMIEHLSGHKHRREYISKEFPDKMRRKPTSGKECKVLFFKRIAGELEKSEGLKMYKTEGYVRPSPSSPLKKKARWEDDYKHENDPVRKQKALEFLETFHITSDSEATLVVHITQGLMEALKAFCEKKAADNGTNSSGPLMSVPQDEFPERKSDPEHYGPDVEYRESSDWNQGFLSQYEECSEDASCAPAHPNSYQADDGTSYCHLKSDNFAMMSPLTDSPAVEPDSATSGVSKWLRQLRNSVSCRNLAVGTSSYETNPVKEYSAEYISSDVQGSELCDNRLSFGRENTKWRNQQVCKKARHISDQELPYPNSSASYPSSGRYSTNYPSQSYSSYKNNESVNTYTSSANSAVSGRGGSRWHQDTRWNEWNEDCSWNEDYRWNKDCSWKQDYSWKQESRCQGFRYQKSGYQRDWSSHQDAFSGNGSYRDHQQFRSSDGLDVGLAPNTVNRLLGKGVPTMTRILKQLAP